MRFIAPRTLPVLLTGTLALTLTGCLPEYIPPFFGGGGSSQTASETFTATDGSVATGAGPAFAGVLIQGRTFTHGTTATTVTFMGDDLGDADLIASENVLYRTPFGIDFNGDGKIDPVVGYGEDQAVIQILLSDPAEPDGVVEYIPLTLDSKRDMENLSDVAVGDIDRDGFLDIIASAEGAVWYFHHPTDQPTTALHLWGNPDPNDDLRERIDASFTMLTDSELQAIITQAVGPGVNLDDYIVTVQQLYTNCEMGDLDNDGDHDIVASRSFVITLTPKPNIPVEPVQIVDGDVMVFVNPGFAADGNNWTVISVGGHERQQRLDRDGASGLMLYDIDADGDLDIISAAKEDNNVQLAWFENPVENRVGAPGPMLATDEYWTQWRIGSIRSAWGLDIGDVTGDGRADVIATGEEQMQVLLYEQPATGPKRSYDWDTHVVMTFDTLQPRDVKAADLDNDGQLELVVATNTGNVRYLERTNDPTEPWEIFLVYDFELGGEIGWIGYGDLDADDDLDLVCVVASADDNASRITWIRNETNSAAP